MGTKNFQGNIFHASDAFYTLGVWLSVNAGMVSVSYDAGLDVTVVEGEFEHTDHNQINKILNAYGLEDVLNVEQDEESGE